jgi:pimeloyl-ACP methyl ester carboxylesterase
LGFDAIARIVVDRSMPRSTPTPDSISSLRLSTCSCRLSTARRVRRGLAQYALQSQSGARAVPWNGAWREIRHPHLVLWCGKDGWIAPAKIMAAAMLDCRLITVPGIGHSMNLESPARDAGNLAHGSASSGNVVAI